MRQIVMNCPVRSDVWNDRDAGSPKSFMGYLQVFREKTTTTLKSTILDVYPVYVKANELFRQISALANLKWTHCSLIPTIHER